MNKKVVKTIGRVIVFGVTMAVLVFAGFIVYQFVKRALFGGGSGSPIDLGSVPGADGVLIGAYLDANAEKLEQPAGDDDTPVAFVVNPGETVAEVAARLQEAGLILDAELFRRYVQYHEMDTTIEAGEFTLRQTMTIPEVAEALQRGLIAEQVVTIQEGLRLEQVAAAVAAQTTIPEDEFLVLATTGWRDTGLSYDFLTEIPPGATLEGFLFPETYRLPEEATAIDLLNRMLQTFDARVTPEMRAAGASHEMTFYELVAMASIVEREAVLDEERPFIASVYFNRWNFGWLLNADPTVQYGMASQLGWTGEWWPQLTPADYQGVISPYNTYLNLGLPPSPICSPGLASIEAAVYPADTDYFYFLVDCTKNDGSHIFAVTEEEHLDNYAMCGGGVP
ncbi:MAG: endolytic transglycosylase MltG [Anaerolineae bacterium]|nr:endolytic transglycosylase MltG [Anaerolineae bacterium]